jgi:hypothetical protein
MSETPKTMQAAYDPQGEKKIKWSVFTEGQLTEFFTLHNLEKLTAEDGNGNKAKLSRTKDNGIKLEQSSTTIL